jgi:hypothetical protein
MRSSKTLLVAFSVLAVGALASSLAVATPDPAPDVDVGRTNAVTLFDVPDPGVDFLHFTVWDTIEVPNVGTDTVELRGTYTIQRELPTSRDWRTAEMDIRLLDMDVHGTSPRLGRVSVALSGSNVGHVYAAESDDSGKLCEIQGGIQMTLHDLGVTVFNKELVPLSHQITHIPPIGQGGSSPEVRIALYDVENPAGEPVAFLRRVRTQIGGYVGR